jgi:Domain of unknown function (DUF4157)
MNAKLQTCSPSRGPQASSFAPKPAPKRLLQRKCACGGSPGPDGECEECKEKRLQRKKGDSGAGTEHGSSVPSIVHEVLRSPGHPLDPSTRAFMEPRLGHDFSQVRVHTDVKASESARVLNALAYTVGRDIVFDHEHYRPQAAQGSFLLAHELVHTLQQDRSTAIVPGPTGELQIGDPNHASETEADTIADRALAFNPAGRVATKMANPALLRTNLVVARYDCSKLTYRTCTTGVYSCGYGGSGTCAWVGPTRGGCICTGADKPSTQRVLEVLTIIGLSITLVASVIAALLDPEPVTKLGLAGLSAAQITLLLTMLGYQKPGESDSTASAETGPDNPVG